MKLLLFVYVQHGPPPSTSARHGVSKQSPAGLQSPAEVISQARTRMLRLLTTLPTHLFTLNVLRKAAREMHLIYQKVSLKTASLRQ